MQRRGVNIYLRKDGRWEARYIERYEGGKAKYRSVYGNTYLKAKRRRLEETYNIKHAKLSTWHAALIEDLCMHWLDSKKKAVKESTISMYRHTVTHYTIRIFSKGDWLIYLPK